MTDPASAVDLAPPSLDALRAACGLDLAPGVPVRAGLRAAVWRHAVEADAPTRSVVVKRYADPSAPTAQRERAAYAAAIEADLPLPRCLAQLDDALILEDVPGEPLDPLPERTDVDTLRRVARALGRVHAQARAAGARLPTPPAYLEQAQVLRDAWPKIEAFFVAAGIPTAGVEPALARLADALATPDPAACTLTLGDMAPSNVLVTPDRVGFVDLEYAGLREPFYDAMFWRVIVPFPPALAATLDVDYHAALRESGWAMSDPAFALGRARAATHRLFWTLSWGLWGLFKRDWPVVPDGPGMRSVLQGYLANLVSVIEPLGEPVLTQAASHLREVLGERWG